MTLREQYDNEHGIPFVRCYRCGELCETAWELLGDQSPDEVTDYLCDACEDEDADYDAEEYDYSAEPDDVNEMGE